MSSRSFASYFKCYLPTVLEVYQPVRDSSTVSLFRFVVGGTRFEGQDYASGDLFHTVAGVTFYRTWTTLHPRVAVHRDHRCLSNAEVSWAIASFPGLV